MNVCFYTIPENHAETDSCQKTGQFVRIAFWNLENLFDTRNDTMVLDDEFTGSGSKHWGYQKLNDKINKTAKTILAAGRWNPPAVIGFCEVENRFVLNRLIYHSPLQPLGYRIIHQNSPDRRGIDVALLYRPDQFNPIVSRWIGIIFPFDTTIRTRDILYVKGVLFNQDTLHLFVNHWPSRRGGERKSAPKRHYVASVLRKIIDSLHYRVTGMPESESSCYSPKVIIMGDFNDEPDNESLCRYLGAIHPDSIQSPTQGGDPFHSKSDAIVSSNNLPVLVNLMYSRLHREGTHKFREHWGLLDQFIVSASLLPDLASQTHENKLGCEGSLFIDPGSVEIFKPEFLMEEDIKYLDRKPFRTYLGPRYQGGFSDHLMILVEVKAGKERD